MIISYSKKFVFVKTRKTAGSTLEKLLYPYLDHKKDICTGSERDGTSALNIEKNTNGHISLKEIKNKFTNIDKFFFFTIERNPWDKVVSSFYFHKKIKPQFFGNLNFEDYILSCPLLPKDWALYQDHTKVQVFKYEYLSDLITYLNFKFKLNISKEELQNTRLKSEFRKIKDYKLLHTNNTINFIQNLFAEEIKFLKYRFNG